MANFAPFTCFELGAQDFERGEPRGFAWPERAAGWDAAYRESLAKAAGGLRRINAGRYESEDGNWSIVGRGKRWSLMFGNAAMGYGGQAELQVFKTFSEALEGLRREAKVSA